jgi:hypothetical protein
VEAISMNCEYHKKSIGGFTIKEKFFLLGHFNIQVQIAENNSMKIDKKKKLRSLPQQ